MELNQSHEQHSIFHAYPGTIVTTSGKAMLANFISFSFSLYHFHIFHTLIALPTKTTSTDEEESFRFYLKKKKKTDPPT